MSRNEYTFIALYGVYRQLLERIEREFVLARRFRGWDMLSDRDIWITRRDSDLMLDLYIRMGLAYEHTLRLRMITYQVL